MKDPSSFHFRKAVHSLVVQRHNYPLNVLGLRVCHLEELQPELLEDLARLLDQHFLVVGVVPVVLAAQTGLNKGTFRVGLLLSFG